MRQKRSYLTVGLILILLFSLFVILAFRGCSYLLLKQLYEDIGSRDWRVVLTNGFEICKLNENDIILTKDDWSPNSSIVISNYINAYCYNERYIGIWCAKDGAPDLLGVDSEGDVFYIIDSLQSVLVDQYTKAEYEYYCDKQNIHGLDDWVFTTPRPKEAAFN